LSTKFGDSMESKKFRLTRFLSRSSKLVVAALDHGAFLGPLPGLLDPREACGKLSQADGVLMASGMIRHVNDSFTGPSSPAIITRLAWNSDYCFHLGYRQGYHRNLLSVAQAVASGADLVVCSLRLETRDERVDAENASLFSRYVQQAAELGIPIIGEFFPPKREELTAEELHRQTRLTCRVLAELGADMIKTFYTGERFGQIVESTPVPILVLGAEKTPKEEQALQLALDAANAGAAGIVFGRNIVQSCNPAGFIDAARAVMTGQCGVAEAITRFDLGESPSAVA
jgi:DhnA family fructose-bisphosphate aldolase class Ia